MTRVKDEILEAMTKESVLNDAIESWRRHAIQAASMSSPMGMKQRDRNIRRVELLQEIKAQLIPSDAVRGEAVVEDAGYNLDTVGMLSIYELPNHLIGKTVEVIIIEKEK